MKSKHDKGHLWAEAMRSPREPSILSLPLGGKSRVYSQDGGASKSKQPDSLGHHGEGHLNGSQANRGGGIKEI